MQEEAQSQASHMHVNPEFDNQIDQSEIDKMEEFGWITDIQRKRVCQVWTDFRTEPAEEDFIWRLPDEMKNLNFRILASFMILPFN